MHTAPLRFRLSLLFSFVLFLAVGALTSCTHEDLVAPTTSNTASGVDDHGSGGDGSDDAPGDDHGSGGHGSDD
ncbi:MAG TPA: hypothetical protein VHL57_01480 [Flavobacteriales bacterium]|nr:hypothetical protein [Flavobacteriales bacterium]